MADIRIASEKAVFFFAESFCQKLGICAWRRWCLLLPRIMASRRLSNGLHWRQPLVRG